MIEISILELLYLVATFFLVIIGTLLTLVLIRIFKILSVGIELTNYYWQMKRFVSYYRQVPFVIKDKIFDFIAWNKDNKQAEEATEK
jgi:ABC-type methionine transport system permease subunit